MPENLTFRDFRGGWNQSEDSADLQGWKNFKNVRSMQLGSGGTVAEVRPPVDNYAPEYFFVDLYDAQDNLEQKKTPNAGHQPFDIPEPTGFRLMRVVLWTSGLFTAQHNTMLIYRSNDLVTSSYDDEYEWKIYSNAPYLTHCQTLMTQTEDTSTRPGAWHLFETITAPQCEPAVLAGDVRLLLGTRYDYRILTYVSDQDGERTIFAESTSADPLVLGGQSNESPANALGDGGYILNGWLYDYGKLYQKWGKTGPWSVAVSVQTSSTKGLGLAEDSEMEITLILAPVYDRMTKQVGVPQVIRVEGSTILSETSPTSFDQAYLDLEIAASHDEWNYRLIEFAVYMQISSEVNDKYGFDYNYVGSVYVDDDLARDHAGTISHPNKFLIDKSVLNTSQRTWATDSALSQNLGRDLPTIGDASNSFTRGGSFLTASDESIAEQEELITIRAKGMTFHKKTNYAWGVSDDSGGLRIRQSAVSGAIYHPDVFDVALVVWQPESAWPVTRLVAYQNRILELHEIGAYYLDAPEYPIHQGTWLYAGESVGAGLGIEYFNSLAIGPRGVFWANDEGIWVWRDTIPENIVYGRLWETWRNLTLDQRRQSIGGYNLAENEYWLAVYPSTPAHVWDLWIYSDTDPENREWRHYQIEGQGKTHPVAGWFSDHLKRFVQYGTDTFGTGPRLNLFDADDVTTDYDTQNIEYAIRSQERGSRANQIIVTGYQVEHECDSAHEMTVTLRANGGSAASVTSVILGENNRHIGIKPLRCSTVDVEISGSYSAGTRPKIKEITLYYEPSTRRRK